MLFRLDDTNPAKENEDFVISLKEDMSTLRITYASISYTSDWFE